MFPVFGSPGRTSLGEAGLTRSSRGRITPADGLQGAELVAGRLCHMHGKDISIQQSESDRGEKTGTPVGCACGEGVIDWPRVIEILRKQNVDTIMSVECGTVEQAGRSLSYLQGILWQSADPTPTSARRPRTVSPSPP